MSQTASFCRFTFVIDFLTFLCRFFVAIRFLVEIVENLYKLPDFLHLLQDYIGCNSPLQIFFNRFWYNCLKWTIHNTTSFLLAGLIVFVLMELHLLSYGFLLFVLWKRFSFWTIYEFSYLFCILNQSGQCILVTITLYIFLEENINNFYNCLLIFCYICFS